MAKNKQYIYYAIIAFFMFIFGFLPPFGPVTQFGMQVLGIFIGLIFAWTVDIVMWPCLLGMLLLATIQGTGVLQVLSSCFSNSTLLNVTVILWFCYGLDRCGFLDYIGKWTMSKSFIKKGPYYLMGTLWAVAFVGSALCLSNGSMLLMLWSIFYKISQEANIPKFSAYSNCMLVGIAVISYCGCIVFPFAMWPNVVFGFYASATGTAIAIPYGTYMLFNFLAGVFAIVCGLLITKYIIRPKTNFDLNAIEINTGELKMNAVQKFALGAILASVVLLLSPALMPAEWAVTKWLNNMSTTGIFFIVLIAMSFFKDAKTGKSIVDLADVVRNGMSWRQFFLLATAFYSAGVVTGADTGVSELLSMVLGPILENKGVTLTVIIFIFASVVATNLFNNVVCASVFMPLVALFAGGTNVPVLLMGMSAGLIQGCAFPSGSVVGGLLHGNKEWLKSKDVYIYAAIYTLIVATVLSVLTILWS